MLRSPWNLDSDWNFLNLEPQEKVSAVIRLPVVSKERGEALTSKSTDDCGLSLKILQSLLGRKAGF